MLQILLNKENIDKSAYQKKLEADVYKTSSNKKINHHDDRRYWHGNISN